MKRLWVTYDLSRSIEPEEFRKGVLLGQIETGVAFQRVDDVDGVCSGCLEVVHDCSPMDRADVEVHEDDMSKLAPLVPTVCLKQEPSLQTIAVFGVGDEGKL